MPGIASAPESASENASTCSGTAHTLRFNRDQSGSEGGEAPTRHAFEMGIGVR
jgi:hypothetical protein